MQLQLDAANPTYNGVTETLPVRTITNTYNQKQLTHTVYTTMIKNSSLALCLFVLVQVTLTMTIPATAFPASNSNLLEHPDLHKRCVGKYDPCNGGDCCAPLQCQDYYGDGNWICWN
ncbi:hypothetical protein DFQ27_001858 [Actinomortierella ambigua]|uniref:Uncharacterized protein n=1 Tax=Actinomortierella ambigua TaxID=1343610 RepID=A0A9P6U6Y6_9FUNG|nr:hypothetical protein DFQ27_001858 [Actinomortierella ambigua]